MVFYAQKQYPKPLPNQFQNNFEKIRKTAFLTLEIVLHIDYLGHLASFRAENTPKSGPVKAKNNAQTTSKQLQNNFQKVKRKQLF